MRRIAPWIAGVLGLALVALLAVALPLFECRVCAGTGELVNMYPDRFAIGLPCEFCSREGFVDPGRKVTLLGTWLFRPRPLPSREEIDVLLKLPPIGPGGRCRYELFGAPSAPR